VRRAAVALVLVLIAAPGCGKSSAPAGAGTGSAGSGSARAAAQPAGTIAVFVDDAQVALIDATQLATWPRVDGVVPETAQRLGTWASLAVRGTTDQVIPAPADRYPSLVPAVYPGPDGPAFGMFDLVDHVKKATPRLAITGVRELRITLAQDSDRGANEDGGKPGSFDPNQIVVAIEGGTKPKLTGPEIFDLPREPPPNGDINTQGWRLTTLLAAAGIKQPRAILLTDAAQTSLTLTAQQLDPATSVPYLKLNRQGQLRFRVYTKQGTGWTLGGNLTGLSSIKVVQK
jgi:hypothetical protein